MNFYVLFLARFARAFRFGTLALMICALSQTAGAQIAADGEAPMTELETKAREFLRLFFDRKAEQLAPLMDEAMNTAMPPEQMERIVDAVQAQAGALQSMLESELTQTTGFEIVFVTCQFERVKLKARVVYNGEGLVAGLQFVPAGPEAKAIDPPYADREKFEEEETEVVTGDYRLGATLTIPKGAAKPPVVVLVHGSGPNDRDETIGPNKVFRDLAWGLATRGVASLRYEKRTRAYGIKLDIATLTHREETVEDALSAISLVAGDDRFDHEKIAVVGHSLGGLLAPLIASESSELDAVAIMAGSNRPLLEIMEEQFEYIYGRDGEISAAEKKLLEDFRQSAADLMAGEPGRGILASATKHYFESLNAYDALGTARKLTIPILVTQGGRDYQVLADKDYKNWERALEGRPNVTMRLYPDLDHLYMSGVGPSYPSDYSKPRNVSEEFITDLAEWLAGL